MRNVFITTIVITSVITACSDTPPREKQVTGFEALSGPYLGQEPPGAEPQIFMPGLVSTHDLEGCVAFLDEGKVFVFFRGQEGLQYTFEKDGRWTAPQEAPFQNRGFTDFTAGPDGRTVYFQSRRPTTPEDKKDDSNTWAVRWTGSGWTDPYPLPSPANTDESNESYPSMAPDGSLYLFTASRKDSRFGDVYRSRFIDGEYLEIERFGEPINTDYHEVDPVVAPDGSYLLFGSGRPGGYDAGDLYVSFRRGDGTWTHPHNSGKTVNPLIMPIRMSVTPDGKYFFFLSDHPTDVDKGVKIRSAFAEKYSDTDVYWIETGFIEDLRTAVINKRCAAQAIRSSYRDNGLHSAIDKLDELYPNREDEFYFEVSELLVLCGSMIDAGKGDDAEQFYEALLETLPETFRIKQGYAVAKILNGSTAKGLSLLSELWAEYPSAKSESSMDMLKYHLSAYSKTDDELLLLEFFTNEFPDSYKAFYNLAQAHSLFGDQEQAIQSCRRSLELKPDFADAVQLLDSLKQ
jgi:tetratricopeptide (TPR) repeat protein